MAGTEFLLKRPAIFRPDDIAEEKGYIHGKDFF